MKVGGGPSLSNSQCELKFKDVHAVAQWCLNRFAPSMSRASKSGFTGYGHDGKILWQISQSWYRRNWVIYFRRPEHKNWFIMRWS